MNTLLCFVLKTFFFFFCFFFLDKVLKTFKSLLVSESKSTFSSFSPQLQAQDMAKVQQDHFFFFSSFPLFDQIMHHLIFFKMSFWPCYQQTMVLKVNMSSEKYRTKAMKIVVGASGKLKQSNKTTSQKKKHKPNEKESYVFRS